MVENLDTGDWYWDRRNRKALRPRRIDDDTVEFVTVWHAEEVADALDGGALVPVDEIGVDDIDTTFDLVDSFRMPDAVGSERGDDDDSADPERGD